MIYSDGTTNLVSGSAIVRGTGTKWKSNINGIAAGQIILIQSGNGNLLHMIQAVNSDTELVLADNARATLNNVKYQIQTTVPDTVSDGVRHMCAINAAIILFLQNMDRWMSENGKVDVEMPNGQKVTLDSIRALQAAMEGKLTKGQNGADIPNKPKFVENLGLAGVMKIGDYGFGGLGQTLEFATNNSVIDWIQNPTTGSQFFRLPRELGVGRQLASSILIKTKTEMDGLSWAVMSVSHIGKGVVFTSGYGNHSQFTQTALTDANTTKDNNGFIKKASPIIQLHPDGTFTTNDESEGATVTKLGLGHYKISGILGYNADGAWGVHGGISVPRDVNGNELVYVDDKVLPDGAIEIKVTHRQNAHMPARLQNRRIKSQDEQTHYTDDEACDLPAGTRLDVRVQMPEDSIWNRKQ
ncbi:hypothetical protein, partial [Xenorhabdus bovienii]|uniref:phage tail fiber protein n=1 Tax=Xenorhabdus bovienii TaxID=40576 RepID=UPI000690E192